MKFLDVQVKPVASGRVAMRVVYQNPAVSSRLPFTASDGTVLTSSPSGRPFVGVTPRGVVVGLRGPDCPDVYRNEPVEADVSDAQRVRQAARNAVKELRRALSTPVGPEARGHAAYRAETSAAKRAALAETSAAIRDVLGLFCRGPYAGVRA